MHAVVGQNRRDLSALRKVYEAILAGREQVRVAFLSGEPGVIFTQAHRSWLLRALYTNA